MASAARGATAPRLKQVNLSERALRLLRVDIARINVGKPHMVTISDPLRSAAAVPVLDLAKHLGAEVVGDRAADVPREAAHAQAVGGVALDSTVRSARSFDCEHAAKPRPLAAHGRPAQRVHPPRVFDSEAVHDEHEVRQLEVHELAGEREHILPRGKLGGRAPNLDVIAAVGEGPQITRLDNEPVEAGYKANDVCEEGKVALAAIVGVADGVRHPEQGRLFCKPAEASPQITSRNRPPLALRVGHAVSAVAQKRVGHVVEEARVAVLLEAPVDLWQAPRSLRRCRVRPPNQPQVRGC